MISAWTPCSDEASYDLSGEVDGTYTFSVRATDAAGNTGPESHSDYVLDTTLPVAPTITASPAAVISSRTPSWSFTGEAGADFECRLDTGGGAVVFAWGPCTSPKSYPLIAQPDGDFTFSVRAVDAAGNAGPAATNSFTLDTLAPSAPTITAWPASPGDDESPSWAFTAEAGATVECRLDRGNDVVQTWAGCSGSESFDLSSEPDGTYTFSVRATDAAGNVGALATNDYVLDTTAPDAPDVTSAPGSPSSDESPTWSFTAEPGAALECSLDPQGSPASAWGACTSPETFDLSSEPNGDFTLSIRATDAAGNVGTATTSDYTLDRTAIAAPTINSGPPATGTGRNPSWTFSAPGAASYECRLTPGSNPAWSWQPCTSAHGYDLTGAPDDTYTFSVRALDGSNNPSAATSEDYTLDTQKPAPPTFDSVPPSPGNDQQPTWSISAEAGATLECELTRGATPVAAWGCGSTASRDLSAEPDGTYTLSVRARDAAGNLGDPATTNYVLDTAAPVTGITSAPPSPRANRAPAWSFDAEIGADYECRLDRGGTTVAGWSACTSPHPFDLTAAPDGTYTFSVKATDEAGNTGPVTTSDYVLDSTAPAAPTVTSSPASPAAGRSPSWSFTGEAGTTLRCRLDRGPDTISGWAPCSGVASYDLTGEPDATYTFSVQATDGALNPGPITTRNYTLDTTPPGLPTITSSPSTPGTSPSPGWSFAGAPGTTFQCRLDRGTTPMSGWAPCSGSRDYDLTGEADGVYTFSVRAIDAVGNVGAARTSDYELVTTAPPQPSFLSEPAAVGNTLSAAWSFSGSAGSTFECRLERGADVIDDWAPCVSPRTFDLSGKPDGTYELAVRSVNAVGLRSTAARSALLARHTCARYAGDQLDAGHCGGQRHAGLVVLGRCRGDVRMPPGPRLRRDRRLGGVQQPARLRARRAARRRLRVLGPRARRGGQHEPGHSQCLLAERVDPWLAPPDRGPASRRSPGTARVVVLGRLRDLLRVPVAGRRRRHLGLGGVRKPPRLRLGRPPGRDLPLRGAEPEHRGHRGRCGREHVRPRPSGAGQASGRRLALCDRQRCHAGLVVHG